MTIHLCHQGRQLGAFSNEQVEAMLKGGVITSETLAWAEGLAEWKKLREVLASQAPPPIRLNSATECASPGVAPVAANSSDALGKLKLEVEKSAPMVHKITGNRLTDNEARHVFSKAIARFVVSGEPKTKEDWTRYLISLVKVDANDKITAEQALTVYAHAKATLLTFQERDSPATTSPQPLTPQATAPRHIRFLGKTPELCGGQRKARIAFCYFYVQHGSFCANPGGNYRPHLRPRRKTSSQPLLF